MADLTRQLFAVDRMLRDTIGATSDVRVTIGARWHLRAIVAMGVLCAIAVEFLHLVTADAGHPALHPVDVTLYTLILALVFGAGAPTVTRQARVFDRCHFFEGVARDQTATGERRAADVALTASRVTTCAMVRERLSHLGIVQVGTAGLQYRFVSLDGVV
jgi:hypothetical protein